MAKNRQEELSRSASRPRRKQLTGPADYGTLDGTKVLKLVEQLANWGCAIRFGKTRDGGAYAIGVYGVDKEPYTEYIPPAESVEEFLEDIANWMEGRPPAPRI